MANFTDQVLERFGVKYEDLTPPEKETLESWENAVQTNSLSIDKIRAGIANMKVSVEYELSKVDLSDKQDTFLKARLRNLLLIEAFLSTQNKAKANIEQMVAGIASGVG